ncbi:MAG: acyl-CoA dehydrogenase family protein [Burkholderiales bacterium]|nr:acyl-CoA dehydrogenase family protein [Burkholderiales bacterium]
MGQVRSEKRGDREGDESILNGEKCFIANGSVARLFFVNTRTNPNVRQQEGGTTFLVPIDTPACVSARFSTRAAGASTRTRS